MAPVRIVELNEILFLFSQITTMKGSQSLAILLPKPC